MVSFYDRIVGMLEGVNDPYYIIKDDAGKEIARSEVLGQLVDTFLSELPVKEVRHIQWLDTNTFTHSSFNGVEYDVSVSTGGNRVSGLSNQEKVEFALLLSGDNDMEQDEVDEVEEEVIAQGE